MIVKDAVKDVVMVVVEKIIKMKIKIMIIMINSNNMRDRKIKMIEIFQELNIK